ncbi:tRNA(Met)-cytidine N(4)-acetyltransferase [Marinobacter daqiaonensis]|uniref:tRNA(Met) cytidine acetyltransferase TmcA n=1 Tax=Marinobacter daqiaonensis TaxID=650891 RepID=A0A1I6JQ04_9GAMM|nr:GNAT family N-acetyltransferase [Marinobacter daqiaonensis]SFR81069.1 tRNA(Met)-cytidine N(4)-acetyltransferase [Marinobacter daqiaonensis]
MSGSGWRAFAQRLRERGERRLVVVEGSREQALQAVGIILSSLSPSGGLWSGPAEDSPHPALAPIKATSARHYLGTETSLLVWDGWQGNPPDSLAALAGTLSAGGLWVWLMPPMKTWRDFPDPDYDRVGLAHNRAHPFLARAGRLIAADGNAIRLTAGQLPASPALPPPPDAGVFRPASTDDQARAVSAITGAGLGRRRRPLVITADRGRGKSAALGIAAARLLKGGRRRIAVVSGRRDSVTTLFRHAAEEAGVPDAGENTLWVAGDACLSWYPVDDMLDRHPEAELVIVDEAAAIPAALLRQVLLGWPRVVFATTVHGYEGSGRGFNLRFREVLARETPQWQAITLEQPIRWSSSDPLEPLVNRLFLLDAEAPGGREEGAVTLDLWHPADASEDELSQAFGLLVDAHYRTTPGDLRQWLDDPDGVSVVAKCQGRIVGVLWATTEGGLSPGLAEKVSLGQRRLRGHLLPQSLANHGGLPAAATLRLLRVVRIAVSEAHRRSGIGHELLAMVCQKARSLALDAVGTSYGGAPDLLAFWRSAGFAVVRLGIRHEASSGEYGVQMMKGLSEKGGDIQQRLASRFSEQWSVLLPVVWPTLAADLVLAISADLPPAPRLTAQEMMELEAFAHGHRGFELTLPALKRLSGQPGIALAMEGLASGQELWVAAVLQNRDWQTLRGTRLCLGRGDGEQRLRAEAATMLAALSS